MERRESTRRLLAGLAPGGSPGTAATAAPSAPRLLLAAGPPGPLAALGRFGFAVDSLPPEGTPPHPWAVYKAVVCGDAFPFAAELALGLQVTPQARAMVGGLWHGVPLYLAAWQEPGAGCPQPLAAQYRQYAKALAGMGAHIVPAGQLAARLMDDLLPKQQKAPPQTDEARPAGGRVVTQRAVAAHTGGEFPLPPGAVVTPLARDEAAKRGIVFIKQVPRTE